MERQFHDELHVNRRGTSYEKNIILHKKSEYAINFSSDEKILMLQQTHVT
jgi:hypothetical protein